MFELRPKNEFSKDPNLDMELERKKYAQELLDTLLSRNMPPRTLLSKLYVTKHMHFIKKELKDFLQDDSVFENKTVRPVKDISKTKLFLLKKELGEQEFYQDIISSLNSWNIPDDNSLKIIFGHHYKYLGKQFTEFVNLKKERSCDLPYTAHLMRCAMMSYAKYGSFDSNALWGSHDSVEDLLYSIREKNERKYSLTNLDSFLDEYIPKEIHEDLLLVTNSSDLILKYLKIAKNVKLNTNNYLDYALQKLRHELKNDYLSDCVEQMITANQTLDTNEDNFYEDVKWHFYKHVFLENLVKKSSEKRKLETTQGKGEIDLYDNFVGMNARDLRDRRRSILKMIEWSNQNEKYISNFFEDQQISLRKSINEIMIQANYGARKIITQYLSEPVALQDHLKSALKSIKELNAALYITK